VQLDVRLRSVESIQQCGQHDLHSIRQLVDSSWHLSTYITFHICHYLYFCKQQLTYDTISNYIYINIYIYILLQLLYICLKSVCKVHLSIAIEMLKLQK